MVANPGVAPPQSQVLAQALDRAVGRKPKDAVARIGGASDWRGRAKDIQESVIQELDAAGVVEPVTATHLGVFKSAGWLVRRPEVESDITTRIAAVLDGGQPDAPRAALISIVTAIDLLPRSFPNATRRQCGVGPSRSANWVGAGRRSRRPSRRSRPRSPPQ